MSLKVHQATSSTPELEQILEKNQKTPFAVHISNVSVRHDNKIKLKSYEGNTDPQQFLSSFSVATQRDHFHPSEAEAGKCQLFSEHLTRAALNWFSDLPANSIGSFLELSNKQSKEKVQDDYCEPRQHYNHEYQQETKRKAASYLVSEADPVAQPANFDKARRTDEDNRLDQYCDFHKRSGHSTAACRHLQSILLNKYKKGDIEVQHRQYKSHNNTYAARGGRDGNNVFHRLGPHTGR